MSVLVTCPAADNPSLIANGRCNYRLCWDSIPGP